MEYDNENLEQHLFTIKSLISECDFVAIDTELTGLSKHRTNYYDTPEMRYKHVKDNSMEYAITQFGICLFKFNASDECFDYFPMNFLVKQYSYDKENGNFLINSNTIAFLNENSFDFNRVFQNGISFINYHEYEKRKTYQESRKENSLNNLNNFDIDVCDWSHYNDLITKCRDFLLNDDLKEMNLGNISSSFDSYLIFNELWKKVGCVNGKWISPSWDKSQAPYLLMIRKSDNAYADYRASINENFDRKQEKLNKLIRMADIVKHIGQSNKPIVAHNSFLDILHMVDKFIGPLPETYQQFKMKINNIFPRIFDTKHIVHDDTFKHFKASNLKDIYEKSKKHLVNPVTKPFSEEFDFPNESAFHTAHYDAMITGKIFISLLTELNGRNMDLWTQLATETPNILTKFLNRIKVVGAELNHFNFNLNAKEKKSVRRNIFHMTFPIVWEKRDVLFYFSKFLQKPFKDIYQTFDITWLSSTCLVIKLPINEVDKFPIVHKNDDPPVRVVSFYEYFNVEDPDSIEVDKDGFQQVKRRKCNKLKD